MKQLQWIKTIILAFFCTFSWSYCFALPLTEGIQTYQKKLHMFPEHQQKLAADIYRYQTADNLWDVLRRDFILPHYEDTPQVQEQISWFLNHQDYLMECTSRAAPYMYFILQQVHKRHLPAETVLLPMIESSYNPFAYSTKGAAGIWQMMPGTASGFGIKQNWWYDGRRDILLSTRAALDYLSYLGNFFSGNWLLAIAAYDTGEGNVLSAIRKNIREGHNTDFWSLPLSQETRIYIPRLLALATIISHPEEYLVSFPPVRNAPYLAQIDIGAQINLKEAADIAGLSLKKLKQLNPGYNHSLMDPHGNFKLVLPIEHVQQFTENLDRSAIAPPINTLHYQIKSGDTLTSIAQQFNITPNKIRELNPKLALNLKTGNFLLIPNSSTAKKSLVANSSFLPNPVPPPVDNALIKNVPPANPETDSMKSLAQALENIEGEYSLQPGDTLYMVRSGDDYATIANRFHLPVQTLMVVNQLTANSNLPPGKQLIIPTHLIKKMVRQTEPLRSPIYVVKEGENMEDIAEKFHTTPAAIRIANLLVDNSIHTGEQLVIPSQLG